MYIFSVGGFGCRPDPTITLTQTQRKPRPKLGDPHGWLCMDRKPKLSCIVCSVKHIAAKNPIKLRDAVGVGIPDHGLALLLLRNELFSYPGDLYRIIPGIKHKRLVLGKPSVAPFQETFCPQLHDVSRASLELPFVSR